MKSSYSLMKKTAKNQFNRHLNDISEEFSTIKPRHVCNNSELNPETMLDDLKNFISNFYGFDPEEVSVISKFFLSRENPFLKRGEIVDQSGVPEGDYDAMIENGILVPDDLYTPQKYRLSPDLAFFKLDL